MSEGYNEGYTVDERLYPVFLAALLTVLEAAVAQYQQSAPVVARWADDLYLRLQGSGDDIPLSELGFAFSLQEDGRWMAPNVAANLHYKLLDRLGRSTEGLIGW